MSVHAHKWSEKKALVLSSLSFFNFPSEVLQAGYVNSPLGSILIFIHYMCCNLGFSLLSKGSYAHHSVLAIKGLITAAAEQTVSTRLLSPCYLLSYVKVETGAFLRVWREKYPGKVYERLFS